MDDDEALMALKQQVVSSERMEMAQEQFLKKTLQKMKFVQAPFSKDELWKYTDSALRKGNTSQLKIKPSTLLFSIGSEKTLAENWVMYNRAVGPVAQGNYNQRWDEYVMQSANTYYKQNIAKYEPGYAEQLKEFKDANLLFAAMEKNVWSRAANDSAGLKSQYEKNKKQYTWGSGATALMVTATDSISANTFSQLLLAGSDKWRKLAEDWKETVIADSGRFEISQLPVAGAQSVKPGMLTTLVRNPMDNSFSFAFIFDPVPGGDTRSFEDARGWVIGDYQQVLEAKWLDALKKKYPVKVNEAVWQQTLKVN
jgi:peptidyl-prolyl cis-trans isomerase SurA